MLMHLPFQSPAVVPPVAIKPLVERIEILEAFAELPDARQTSGKRHNLMALHNRDMNRGNHNAMP